MHSSTKYTLAIGILFVFLLSLPASSGFSSSDFLTDYRSFIAGYISFFKSFGLTGSAVNGGAPPDIEGEGFIPPAPQPRLQYPCSTSEECPIGYYCQNNNCYQRTCYNDADCPSNLVCRNGVCGLPSCASDRDRDGICDATDNCPNNYNFDQSDIDEDGVGDVCDNCFRDYNPDQLDSHRPPNGRGDICDPVTDIDRDGVRDEDDNCPTIVNPYQEDSDLDGIGDNCDPCPLIAGPCNNQCAQPIDSCEAECPNYPDELADSDNDGFAWAGCFTVQSACNQMLQCCNNIEFTSCGDCDDVDDPIGRSSYPGASELCGDGADNDCDGDIDEGCDSGGSYDEDEERYTYLIIRNKNPRSASARETMLLENLDLNALRAQLVIIQEELSSTQATLKAVLAYLYVIDSTSQQAQSLAYLQNDIEQRLAQARSLVAKIDANEPKEILFDDVQRFTLDIEQTNLALKDTLTRL